MKRVDDPRLTTLGLFLESFEGVLAKATAQLAEHGLDAAEFGALLRLARTPGRRLRMSDLAAQTTLSTSGITRVVDRLEREGLVERVVCEADRRGFHATLTRAGSRRLEAALPGHLDVVETWLTGRLAPDELVVFESALRTVRDAVRPGATAGAGRVVADGAPVPAQA